jgi:hypothetical protein
MPPAQPPRPQLRRPRTTRPAPQRRRRLGSRPSTGGGLRPSGGRRPPRTPTIAHDPRGGQARGRRGPPPVGPPLGNAPLLPPAAGAFRRAQRLLGAPAKFDGGNGRGGGAPCKAPDPPSRTASPSPAAAAGVGSGSPQHWYGVHTTLLARGMVRRPPAACTWYGTASAGRLHVVWYDVGPRSDSEKRSFQWRPRQFLQRAGRLGASLSWNASRACPRYYRAALRQCHRAPADGTARGRPDRASRSRCRFRAGPASGSRCPAQSRVGAPPPGLGRRQLGPAELNVTVTTRRV